MKRFIGILLCIVLLVTFTFQATAISLSSVKSIKLNNTNVILKAGKNYNLKATVSPSSASNKKVTYTSSNKSVATVNSNGNIYGLKAGLATITVTSVASKKVTAKCNVTITKMGPYVKINWYVPLQDTDPAQQAAVFKAFNDKLKQKINVEVDFQALTWDSYDTKMGLLAGSGEAIDLMFVSSWMNSFYQLQSKGALMPLSPTMLQLNAPEMMAELPSFVWLAPKVSGKIFAVPNYQKDYFQWAIALRKEYVNKFKFDYMKVKTYKDLESYLAEVKTQEPDSLGTADLVGTRWLNYEQLGNSAVGIKRDGSNGMKVVNTFDTPEYIADLALRRDWFLKGYVRKDVLTVNDEYNEDDIKAGKYAAYTVPLSPDSAAAEKTKTGLDTIIVPLNRPFVDHSAGVEAMTAIGANSKHADRALQVLNVVNTQSEMINLLTFGIKDQDYKVNPDGRVQSLTKKYYGNLLNWILGNVFNSYLDNTQALNSWTVTKKLNETSKPSPIMGFCLDTSALKTQIASINAVVTEYDPSIRKGAIDYKARYAEFLSKLKAAGVDTYIATIQKQINDWAKTR